MESYSDHELTLRPMDISDIDDFMKWYSDEKVSKFWSWEPFTTREAAFECVLNNVINHPWHKAICISGRAVGSISVSQSYEMCRAEIGYVLGSKYWCTGIATKAVKMAAKEVFLEWRHLKRLEAVVDVENLGSIRVLEEVGFQREGVLRKYFSLNGKSRDAVMFSLLDTDPQVEFSSRTTENLKCSLFEFCEFSLASFLLRFCGNRDNNKN